MKSILLGNHKSGWEVSISDKTITLYHMLNLVEKLRKDNQQTVISFDDIKDIVVSWSNVPLAAGDNQHFIIFTVNLSDGKSLSFEGTKNDITKEQFKNAITLLRNANIHFNDSYSIIDSIIQTDKSIWEILNEAELIKRERVK